LKLVYWVSVPMLIGSSFAQTAPPLQHSLGQVELTALMATGSTSERLAQFVRDRGIDFTPDEAFLKSLADDGAEDSLLSALRSASGAQANTPTNDAALKAAAVLIHLHRAAQLNRNNFHPHEAEPEFREAVAADPANPFAHVALGLILARTGQTDAGILEIRTALNLQPNLPGGHFYLGDVLLASPAQHREALSELQQAVTSAPSDAPTRYAYATALALNGDKDGAAEQRKIASGLNSAPPFRIRIGGQVMQAKLVSKAQPRYPNEAKAAHIEGTVRMDVLVGKDGQVKDIAAVNGAPILSEAAVNAVKRWRYRPTLLNGQPVEVVTEIDVNFTLRR